MSGGPVYCTSPNFKMTNQLYELIIKPLPITGDSNPKYFIDRAIKNASNLLTTGVPKFLILHNIAVHRTLVVNPLTYLLKIQVPPIPPLSLGPPTIALLPSPLIDTA